MEVPQPLQNLPTIPKSTRLPMPPKPPPPIRVKEDTSSHDPRGFEYFNQLPQEIQLAIFDFVSFCNWVLKLSPVCTAWRKLVTQCNRRKILSPVEFYNLTGARMPFAALLEVTKNYQIYGLDFMEPDVHAPMLPELLAASKQLTWVSIPNHWVEKGVEINMLPNTVLSVSFGTWEAYQRYKTLFPNIKELKCCDVDAHKYFEGIQHPHLKILHTVVAGYDGGVDLLQRIRSVAPSIEVLHLQLNGRTTVSKLKAFSRWDEIPDSSLESEENLEKLAAEMGLTLYCRNLFNLIKEPNLFIESFLKQGLSYSYYVQEPHHRSLFLEACHSLSLPVVKFLLDNGHTTLQRECRPRTLPNVFNRVPEDRGLGTGYKSFLHSSSLFSPDWKLSPDSKLMIDYLLKEGFDVHSVVQGRSLFAYLQADVIQYILENTPVDLKRRINDAGDAILHVLLSNGAFNGLRSATDKLSKEEIVELFSVKNNAGDTPLHSSQSFGEGAVEYFLELDLGIVWTMPNSRNETPLSLILTKRKASMHILNTILPSVPFIPPGLVSIVFSQGAIDLQSIQRLADRGADFNEIVNGDAAIMNLVPTSALVRELAKFGVNFNVSDSNNENLLFHAFKSPQDSTDVLELLVKEYKLSVNQANYSGITPLVRAMTLNRPSSEVAKLLELGANPNPTSTTDSPLSLISQFSAHQTERLELLLKAGADPNMKLYNASRTKVVIPLVTILNSSNDEALELLKLLVQYGANLNMRDDVGNTLLHLLEKDVHTKYLLKVIDVHETNIFGQTALWNKGLSPPGFYMILKVDPNLVNYVANDGSTVLFAKHDNEKMLLLSLDNIDLSVVNKRGQSFMHNRYSCPQIFSKLAETYARQSEETKLRIRQAFNHVDAFGRTVLHYVCEHGLTFAKQMIETFELDINPNARTLNLQIGWSEDVVEYLLAKGSNPNAQSPATGDTFLHFICGDPSKADLIRTLLKYGASIDVKNSSGISPADLDPNLKSEYRFATWSVEFATKESKRRENEGPNPDYWEVD